MAETLSAMLRWFESFNWAELYSANPTFWSAVLYFTLFLSLVWLSFHRMFPGRPGRMLSVALAALLTAGFLYVEERYGLWPRFFGG